MQIEVEQLSTMRVGAVRHVGPYQEIGKAFQQLGAIAGPAGLFQAPNAAVLGIYHDDPRQTPADQCRGAAAIVVADAVPLPDGLEEDAVPAGRYARATHIGSYEGLPAAWEEFTSSLGSSDLRPREGPGLEVYRNDMATTPPDQLRTDLYMPVE